MPAARRAALHVEAAVGIPGASGDGVAAAAVAESFLQVFANIAGPFIGGHVRIAVMQGAQGTGEFAVLLTIELFEEGNQRGGVFDGKLRRLLKLFRSRLRELRRAWLR